MNTHLFFLTSAFAFAFGACVGSFLNVVIWRLPRNESLISPPSHCPKCNHRISAWENIPLISYLLLRGRCHQCALHISARYPIIELTTAILFVGVWGRIWNQQLPIDTGIAFFYLASAAVAIALIDWENLIIPDEITYTGILLAFILAVAVVPEASGPETTIGGEAIQMFWVDILAKRLPRLAGMPRLVRVLSALLSLSVAMGFLWSMVEVGKRLWGRLVRRSDKPLPLEFTDQWIEIPQFGREDWIDLLYRRSDCFKATVAEVESLDIDLPEPSQAAFPVVTPIALAVRGNELSLNGQTLPLANLRHFRGSVTEWEIPREVMGFGDVKMMAMLGALLGLKAAIFILMLAALGGCFTGLVRLVLNPESRHRPIPFGPFLSLGTLVWIFMGPELVQWYGSLLLSHGLLNIPT